MHRAAAVDAVEAILPRIRSAGVALAPEELQELCELASAPVRTIVGDEDHVPTKARALEVSRCIVQAGATRSATRRCLCFIVPSGFRYFSSRFLGVALQLAARTLELLQGPMLPAWANVCRRRGWRALQFMLSLRRT